MDSKIFNSLEIDAIGEILNISLGASATAVSTMLSRRVDITTPNVKVVSFEEFEFSNLEPAIGVEITYISGLQGNNIMLLKRHDIKIIVEILMGMEIPDDEFELNELNLSAVCEVMNQMMGASSTALSEFLGELVNISTPISFEIKDVSGFKKKYFPTDDPMVVVSFTLKIESVIESEFINVMPVSLAKRLVSAFGLDVGDINIPVPEPKSEESVFVKPESGMMSQESIEAMLNNIPAPQPQSSSTSSGNGIMSQAEIEKLLGGGMQETAQPQMQMQPQMQQQPQMQMQPQMQQQPQMQMQPQMQQQPQMQMQPQMQQQPQMQMQQQPQMQMQPQMQQQPKVINVQPMAHRSLEYATEMIGEEQTENLALIMEVPLEVSVEIGRTKRIVKEILEFSQGTLVVLDKLAGEQVDLYVNGQCIAKGDVVVVEDNFGIRITEIIKKPEFKIKAEH